MKAGHILAGLVGAVVMSLMPAVITQAHAEVSARCWAHLADVPAGQLTTPAGDRRYHLEHGEFSPCTEQDASDGSGKKNDDDHRDKKSRYCRKHWFC
ncbi:hypothetical protein SEA_KIPPER29_83 [Mycobacterium phage Kipper29]|uniref:RDF protein n=1 Tax=Mycobacterium phage Neeharika16 TaxID=3158878 RepID=A0AAU8GUG3_9CAUD|nr:hypothetical protein PBI_DAVINCI_81 [Mycobacterium phage DaVinci]AMQ66917.1 hypothetical protein PBI_MCFLY_83 [Mycobacterium phage McFly]QDF15864.1 hypothetical protein SEA_KIPPER29_83 [Mycobacterium phage Kipper29]QXN73174.1 hypothetical protein SEA_COOKIEDOUGH_83 [Mycobacterium Phage Cookiedough]QYW01282.1 hypothetical protein SEA_HOOT_78 [Mycobacterium phage Hoot]UYL86998.1 hypothetical protein SEA_BABULLSEYE_76 [Mycobacterium phage BABullseye]